MKKDWKRLEAWLQANEEKILVDLNPPATTIELQGMERKLGYDLPLDYLECLKVHAGQKGKATWLFNENEFLSIPNVLMSWTAWNDLAEAGYLDGLKAKPDEGIQSVWWSKSWIPFASNGGGDFLCLDMAPSSTGGRGQVIEIFHDVAIRSLVAPSFKNWFTNFIDIKLG